MSTDDRSSPDAAPAAPHGLREPVMLPDGTPALIRPIRPDGGPALAEAVRQLSPTSRYQRFLSRRDHLSPDELKYLTQCDGVNHLALVLTLPTPDQPDPLPVALARCVRDPDGSDIAEVAIAVLDPWQGRGVGTLLLHALARRARQVGIHRWRAFYLADNHAVRRLLERVGTRECERSGGPGVVEAVYALSSPEEAGATDTDGAEASTVGESGSLTAVAKRCG